MKRKNNLDEMQEQKLLHIESKGYWLAFWGLGVSLIIQLIFYGPTNDWRCKSRVETSGVIQVLKEQGALEFNKKMYINRVVKYNSALYARNK